MDVIEIYGGQCMPTEIGVNRRHRAGPNWDIAIGTDLSSPVEKDALWRYVRTCKPRTIIMASPCTAFGPLSHYIEQMRPEASVGLTSEPTA